MPVMTNSGLTVLSPPDFVLTIVKDSLRKINLSSATGVCEALLCCARQVFFFLWPALTIPCRCTALLYGERLDHLPAICVRTHSPALTPGSPLCIAPDRSGRPFVQRAGATRLRNAMTDSAKMSFRSPATIWAALATFTYSACGHCLRKLWAPASLNTSERPPRTKSVGTLRWFAHACSRSR